MLAAEHYPDLFADFVLPTRELLEIHRGKISLHHAKVSYRYPTIRLPYYLSSLAGMPTRIYQTVHDGRLLSLSLSHRLAKLRKNVQKYQKTPLERLDPSVFNGGGSA